MLVAGPLWMSGALTSDYAIAVLPGIAVLGLGTGLVSLPTSIVAFAGVPRAEAGLASGLLTASRQVGVVFGATLLATVFASSTSGARVRRGLSGSGDPGRGLECVSRRRVPRRRLDRRRPRARPPAAPDRAAERPLEDQSLPVEV